MRRKKLCFVVAVPLTAHSFLHDHIAALAKEYDIYLAGNMNCEAEIEGLALAGWHHVGIERNISLWRDIKAVFAARRYFKKMRFDAVHSVTPKAGLIAALAGKKAGIKHRTHIFTGQVWCTRKGVIRSLLKSIDKVIARCDNHVLVDGKSQRDFLVKEGVLREGQAEVFGHGSISGVNSVRFAPDVDARTEIRAKVGIKDNMVCFVFLGRLNRDKGIQELYEAYNRIAEEMKDVFLLLVGPDEDGFAKRAFDYNNIDSGNCCYFGSTPTPEKVLNAGDVFVLPTYREGFGTSVLEAASVGLPCICSDVYGVKDAYVEGETGLLCHVGDADSLYLCMKQMHDNPEMMRDMGRRSRERALRDFNGAELTECWVEFYHSLLGTDN